MGEADDKKISAGQDEGVPEPGGSEVEGRVGQRGREKVVVPHSYRNSVDREHQANALPSPFPAVNVHPVHARREGEDPGALQLHPSSATRSTLITATAARGPASEGWATAGPGTWCF